MSSDQKSLWSIKPTSTCKPDRILPDVKREELIELIEKEAEKQLSKPYRTKFDENSLSCMIG